MTPPPKRPRSRRRNPKTRKRRPVKRPRKAPKSQASRRGHGRNRSFFDFSQLWSAHTERGAVGGFDLWDTGWYYFRFFALPLLGAVLLALAGLQFARGYRESVVANE